MLRAALVFNPAAGRLDGMLDRLRARLESDFALEVLAVNDPHEVERIARHALDLAPDLVIAAGGDGTVSTAAGVLTGSKIPLGIIPGGTSNSIAAALGIPDELEGAIRVMTQGEAVRIDTAQANGRPMLLHANLGLHAATVAETSREAKQRWGVLAYLLEGLVKLADLESFAVEIETSAATIRCRAVNVAVANLAPRKTVLAQGPSVISPVDGSLAVTVVSATNLAEVVATGFHLFDTAGRGEPATRDNVGYLKASRVHIATSPPQPLLVDGEPAGEGRVVVECVPKSLSVMLPIERDVAGPATHEERKLHGLPELSIEPRTSRG